MGTVTLFRPIASSWFSVQHDQVGCRELVKAVACCTIFGELFLPEPLIFSIQLLNLAMVVCADSGIIFLEFLSLTNTSRQCEVKE